MEGYFGLFISCLSPSTFFPFFFFFSLVSLFSIVVCYFPSCFCPVFFVFVFLFHPEALFSPALLFFSLVFLHLSAIGLLFSFSLHTSTSFFSFSDFPFLIFQYFFLYLPFSVFLSFFLLILSLRTYICIASGPSVTQTGTANHIIKMKRDSQSSVTRGEEGGGGVGGGAGAAVSG